MGEPWNRTNVPLNQEEPVQVVGYLKRKCLVGSCHREYQAVLLNGDSRANQEPAGVILSHRWLGNVRGSPRRNLESVGG